MCYIYTIMCFSVLFINSILNESKTDIHSLIIQLNMKFAEQKQYNHTDLRYNDISKEIESLSKMLVDNGEHVILPILNYIHKNSDIEYQFKVKALEIFRNINTFNARQVLLRAALNENGYSLFDDIVAANMYVDTVNEPNEAVKLLESNKIDVSVICLPGCIGVKIDENILGKLDILLQKKKYSYLDYYTWKQVVNVMQADPSEKYILKKIKLMSESFNKLNQLQAIQNKFQWSADTYSGYMSAAMINALAKMKGAKKHLRRITPQQQGLLRWCFIIARGYQGEADVKEEMKSIILNLDISPIIRREALLAFKKLATKDDMGFLNRVATQDPTQIVTKGEESYYILNGKILYFKIPKNVLPEERDIVEEILRKDIMSSQMKRYYLRSIARENREKNR